VLGAGRVILGLAKTEFFIDPIDSEVTDMFMVIRGSIEPPFKVSGYAASECLCGKAAMPIESPTRRDSYL